MNDAPGPMIELAGVSKRFGSVHAVDDVSLAVGRGEFFALLGPSGCGKTTLLRMLAGFVVPTGGEIFIDGEPTAGIPPNRRPTNIVFQNYAIFPHLNVRQNLGYGLLNRKLGKAEIADRVERMLALIRLPGYGVRSAQQLSGGQRQRVALGRALICEPKVLLLDEPLGALDRKLREEMQVELRHIQRSVGITFVFVTHDQEEALSMADRVAIMSRGRVVQVGAPAVLYEAPNCREAAEFIGTINLFPGTVRNVGALVTVDAGPAGTLLAPCGDTPPHLGDAVTIAVRPEKLAVQDPRQGPGPGRNAVRGRLVGTSYVGDRSYHSIAVPGLERRVAMTNLNIGAAPQPGAPDAEHCFAWAVESSILLTS